MIAAAIAVYALYAFLGLLIVRLVMSYVMMFARDFRPTGAIAALLEITFSATDPPIKAIGRFLPPIRLGNMSLDLGFLVVFLVDGILITVITPYA